MDMSRPSKVGLAGVGVDMVRPHAEKPAVGTHLSDSAPNGSSGGLSYYCSLVGAAICVGHTSWTTGVWCCLGQGAGYFG